MRTATGIRTSRQALACPVMGRESLVIDLLMQIVKNVEGNYQGSDYFSLP